MPELINFAVEFCRLNLQENFKTVLQNIDYERNNKDSPNHIIRKTNYE